MFLSGTKAATLLQATLLDIHGTRYYDLVYQHPDEQQPRSTRVGTDDMYTEPEPGDAIMMTYVMNVVTGVQRAAS